MREIFSVRFFIAIGAVAGLLFLLFTFFVARDVVDQAISDNGADAAAARSRVRSISSTSCRARTIPASRSRPTAKRPSNVELMLDPSRKVTVVAGTPGEDDCGRLAEPGACAIVADLLGEGVVWFALVPMGNGRSVPLPAIDSLADGVATLVNGWQLPHAPALDRRCGERAVRVVPPVQADPRRQLHDDLRHRPARADRRRVPPDRPLRPAPGVNARPTPANACARCQRSRCYRPRHRSHSSG